MPTIKSSPSSSLLSISDNVIDRILLIRGQKVTLDTRFEAITKLIKQYLPDPKQQKKSAPQTDDK